MKTIEALREDVAQMKGLLRTDCVRGFMKLVDSFDGDAEIQRDGKTFGVRHVSIQTLEEEISSGHLRGGGSVPGMAS